MIQSNISERLKMMKEKISQGNYVAVNHKNGIPKHDFSNISNENIYARLPDEHKE